MRIITVTLIYLICFICNIACAETYLFVGTHFSFLSEETADGEIYGLGADIAEEIGNTLGHTVIIQLYPWKRAQHMVETGKADVLIAPYKTPERELFMDFTANHFYTDTMVFYVKSDSDITWNGNFSSVSSRRIGVVLGWSYGDDFGSARANLKIDTAPNISMNFKKLLAGRVDILAVNIRNAMPAIAELGYEGSVKYILPPIKRTNCYYGFSKQRELTQFRTEFDQMLKKMDDSGRIDIIRKKYKLE